MAKIHGGIPIHLKTNKQRNKQKLHVWPIKFKAWHYDCKILVNAKLIRSSTFQTITFAGVVQSVLKV